MTRRARTLRAAIGAACVAAAPGLSCGMDVSLGGVADRVGVETPTPPDRCSECGAPCVLAPGILGVCDGAGSCALDAVCTDPSPCDDVPCGGECDPCPAGPSDGCLPPPEPSFCNALGQCLPGFPSCRLPYEPCIGAPCGTPCSVCDPIDPDCVPPPGLHVCDQTGLCLDAARASCDPCFDAIVQLAKLCGEPCDPACQPWEPDCPPSTSMSVCSAEGVCGPPADVIGCTAGFEPCPGDASCGQPCFVCDTNEADCFATPSLFCTGPNGACTDAVTSCPSVDCTGLPCGAQCGFCPPLDPYCIPTFCDDQGACTLAEAVACGGQAGCGNKGCGEGCLLCDDAVMTCAEQDVLLVCNDVGACTDFPYSACGYQPCAGKVCGEQCSDECDPFEPGCMPPMYKTCNPAGQCVDVAEPCP